MFLAALGAAVLAVPTMIGVTTVGPVAGGLFAAGQAAGYMGATMSAV